MTQMRGLLALYWAETVAPPPAPPPEEVCFPPVAAPVTAFSRPAMAVTGFSRGTIAVPASPFARVDVPGCDLGVGYGEDYGFDYGAGSSDVCFPSIAAPVTAFSRDVAPSGVYARGAIGGLAFSRIGAPGDVSLGAGYGDDYAYGYGGTLPESLALFGAPSPAAVRYDRQAALSDLGATRAAAPASAIERMDEPECVSAVGYGDAWSDAYGSS